MKYNRWKAVLFKKLFFCSRLFVLFFLFYVTDAEKKKKPISACFHSYNKIPREKKRV